MSPPLVYPEGLPFPNARPPQDADDYLQDQSQLPVTGAALGTPRNPGALSPQYIEDSPDVPLPVDEVASSRFFRTGPVGS